MGLGAGEGRWQAGPGSLVSAHCGASGVRGRPGKTALLGRGVGVGRVRDGVRGSSWAALGKFGLMGLGFGFGFLSHFYFLPSILFPI